MQTTISACDASILHTQLLDLESFAQLGTSFHSSINQKLVEHGASGTIGSIDIIKRQRRTRKNTGTKIETDVSNWRTIQGSHFFQQSPTFQERETRQTKIVGGEMITWEASLINQQ